VRLVRRVTARRLAHLAAIGLLGLLSLPVAAQKPEFDIQANISPQDILYFEGTVTAQKLCPSGQLQVHNEVAVLVEFIEKGGKFRDLPDRVLPTADESYCGNKLLEGERLEGRGSTLVEICGQEMFPEDEGQQFCVSGTVDLAEADKFRVIARLRHQWAGTFPEVECFYDIAGPYPVKSGVARQRQSRGLLSNVGRFLERSATEIGQGVLEVGGGAAGMLLTGGVNPVGILQSLLLGEVSQQSGALGQALRFIGGAGGAGASAGGIGQVLLGGGSGQSNDLTTALVQGLVARYGGDLANTAIIAGGGITSAGANPTGTQPGGGQPFDVDNLIQAAIGQLQQDLGERLGLRNLRVNIDEQTATISSRMPSLEGHGHLEPIIAYALVDAALAAPWTQAVAATFTGGSGEQLSIAAPTEAARNLAQGRIDVETFLQLCRFADPSNPLLTSGGITGGAGLPSATPAAATPQALLAQSLLPPGWLASGTHPVSVTDLDQIIPGLQLSSQLISWSGMQVVQVNSQPVTVLGLDVPQVSQAPQIMQLIEGATSGQWDNSLLHLATNPPLHAMQSGGRTYLLQGDADPVMKVANLLASGAAQPGVVQVGGLLGLLSGGGGGQVSTPVATSPATPSLPPRQLAPAQPAPTQPSGQPTPATPAPAPVPVISGLPGNTAPPPAPTTPTPPATPAAPTTSPSMVAETPEPLKLKRGYLQRAYLCTGVDGQDPKKLKGPLPSGTDRLGVYLEIKGAPRNSVLTLELVRAGTSLGQRLMGASGDRRTVSFFVPDGGFSPGQHWLEISADDELVSRMLFEVE